MGIRKEIEEIYQEMKEDYKKGKEYAYQYRKTIFWIIMAFITMQFTDILSLGASWQNLCHQNPNLNLKKQKGGAEGITGKNRTNGKAEKTKPAEGEAEKTKPAEGEAEKTKPAEGEAEKTKPAEGEAIKKKVTAKTPSFKTGKLMKLNPFQSFKSLGPISGFMGKMGDFIKGGFFILGLIIAILFVSFIPIVSFCVLMYYILKFIANKFTTL